MNQEEQNRTIDIFRTLVRWQTDDFFMAFHHERDWRHVYRAINWAQEQGLVDNEQAYRLRVANNYLNK